MKLTLAAIALLTAGIAMGQSSNLQSSPILEALGIWNGTQSTIVSHYEIRDLSATVTVPGKEGRIERLSSEEYVRLQKLRQAVTDAEFEIAKAHGVDFGYDPCKAAQTPGAPGYIAGMNVCYADMPSYPDRYEFRGQFLLINVPAEHP